MVAALSVAERFTHPSVVSIRRLPDQPTAITGGVVKGGVREAYAAARRTDYAPVPGLQSIPASVQAQKGGASNPARLPTDGRQADWLIYILPRFAAQGAIHEADLVTDETGREFRVNSAYWSPMGWRLGTTVELV